MKFVWKLGGEAGFGIMTSGLTFSRIASRRGYHIFDYVTYPSLVRGGHNTYEVAVSDKPVYSIPSEIDYLICLNKETAEIHAKNLHKKSIVVYDPADGKPDIDAQLAGVPLSQIVNDLKGNSIMRNTVALGASLALLGADISELHTIIVEQFEKKGKAVVEFNTQFAQKGFDFLTQEYKDLIQPLLKKRENEGHIVMSGNDAFCFGAVSADCRFYSAYPMTPSSSVLTVLAGWQEKTGMVVRHSEDEIAVISSALGASFAGARSAVGTSGGGFALMVESLSYAGIAELSLVVFVSQRPGPATGMPTWTEQGDLLFAVHAGHGEFPKIVLAPGDHEEMIELTKKAFDLADIYQLPVIILSDMLLSESHATVPEKLVHKLLTEGVVNRGKTVEKPTSLPYLRYGDSSDGISERLLPGFPGVFYQANSYEHSEDGHTSELALDRVKQVNKRGRKTIQYLAQMSALPSVYGASLDSAKTILVCWGSSKGVVREAVSELKDSACIHFSHVYPLDRLKLLPFFDKKARYILVENNSTAQFGALLRQSTGIHISEKVLRYDGRELTKENIISYIDTLKTKA